MCVRNSKVTNSRVTVFLPDLSALRYATFAINREDSARVPFKDESAPTALGNVGLASSYWSLENCARA